MRFSTRRRRRVTFCAVVIPVLLGAWLVNRSSPHVGRGPALPAAAVHLPRITAAIKPQAQATKRSDAFAPQGTVLRNVPVQSQLPELPNGCEATSLSMLLGAAGSPVDRLVLAREQPTDRTPPVFGRDRSFAGITRWGNPNEAFVGNVASYGYGIYHTPLARLLAAKVGPRALDFTGVGFADVMERLRSGGAVLVWTTTTMRPPSSWVTWQTAQGPFRATQQEHAVLLVGYTAKRLILNNPLSGKQESVAPGPFIAAWVQMGRQALTVTS